MKGRPKKKPAVYRVSYKDETGKWRGKTFSAPTMKEAQIKAIDWERSYKAAVKVNLPVSEAVGRYISLREETLSPSTVASYKDILRVHIEGSCIAGKESADLSDCDVQLWVSDLIRKGLGTKTVRNCYSLLASSIRMFTKKTFDINLGQEQKPDLYCPSNKDVRKLLKWIRDNGRVDLERAVLLAAFGPLRRGEICALTAEDIKGNHITVNKAVVRTELNTWELKAPKTLSSYRTLEMPAFVVEKLKGIDGKLVRYTPHSLGEAFREAIKKSGVPHFRFHDLRHYAASIMNYQGISDKTIQKRGGWATNSVMKRVYQNEIDLETKRETKQINEYFSKNFSA